MREIPVRISDKPRGLSLCAIAQRDKPRGLSEIRTGISLIQLLLLSATKVKIICDIQNIFTKYSITFNISPIFRVCLDLNEINTDRDF